MRARGLGWVMSLGCEGCVREARVGLWGLGCEARVREARVREARVREARGGQGCGLRG